MSEQDDRQTALGWLRSMFGRGIVVLIPVIITIWTLNIVFNAVDGIILPLFDWILGRRIPGLGFVTMIALVLLVGALSRNLIGRTVFRFFEKVMHSIPLARTIYTATKDLMSAFKASGKGKSFREVVLVEYPRQGSYTVGFVTNEVTVQAGPPGAMVTVYIPNPPNPTSGVMVIVPRSDVKTLEMTVEQGLKFVLSGGIVTQGTLTVKGG